jgi:hypothetical protein
MREDADRRLLLEAPEIRILAAAGKLERLFCFLPPEDAPSDRAALLPAVHALVRRKLLEECAGKLRPAGEARRIVELMGRARRGLLLTTGNPEVSRLCCCLTREAAVMIEPQRTRPGVFSLSVLAAGELPAFLEEGGWLPETLARLPETGVPGPEESPPGELLDLLYACEPIAEAPQDDRLALLAEVFDLGAGRPAGKRMIYAAPLRYLAATASSEGPVLSPYAPEDFRKWLQQLSEEDGTS